MDTYVTEFMRMFEHYWFRAHVEGKTKGSKKKGNQAQRLKGLAEDSSWSDRYYKDGTREMLDRRAFLGVT